MARRGVVPPVTNPAARSALEALAAAPSFELLERVFEACRAGMLVADVTGSTPGVEPTVRTILSTDGRVVLPLFTSAAELRAAVPKAQRGTLQAVAMSGEKALRLALADESVVAVQFDPASIGQVVVREHIERTLAAGDLDDRSD